MKVKRISPRATMPKYQTAGAACFELHADIYPVDAMSQNGSITVGTGLAFEVPPGHVLLIFSRSSQGFKDNTRLANCVGVIDSDYRGEVKVKLTRDDGKPIEVNHGDRIAQAMLVQTYQTSLVEVDELSTTERGEAGFGSTGK